MASSTILTAKNLLLVVVIAALLYGAYYLMNQANTSAPKAEAKNAKQSPTVATAPKEQSKCAPSEVYDVEKKSCVSAQHFTGGFEVEPSEDSMTGSASMYQTLAGDESMTGNALPKDCFPKDQLSPADLLPGDCNSKWAQSVPACQGELGNVNFLTAGSHIGINTIGQSLRNANRQLRSDPPNPQVKVSPWLQSTIEPDVNRRALEIGSTA
jgi:hypothetical protein